MFRVDGKVALVTGAGRGIGRAIALGLARAGARVVIQDLDREVAEAALREIEAAGAVGVAIGGDITDPEFPDRTHAAVVHGFGGAATVSILVNNAAVQERRDWTTPDVSRIEWQYRGNVITPWRLTTLCVPAMRTAGWGRVLNISSGQARKGVASMLGYSMTKAALNNQTTALARDLAPHGITVNAIEPGYFDTHRNAADFPDADTKRSRANWIAMRRVGEPEDVVGTALLLCSDAGSYITGQIIGVDGGM